MTLNLRLRACLAMCLIFLRFEPEVAYKTLAYKKKKCSTNIHLHFVLVDSLALKKQKAFCFELTKREKAFITTSQ